MTSNSLVLLESLLESMALALEKGERLFQPGDAVKYMYALRQGEVTLMRHTRDGNPAILQLARTGDLLAEASLFSERYHCLAIVESQRAELLRFERSALLQQLKQSPQAMFRMLALFSRQIRQQRTMLELHRIRPARQRIYTYFQLYADVNHQVTIDSSYKDLAYQLGLTHEALYRSLKTLENEGKIRRNKNIVQLQQEYD